MSSLPPIGPAFAPPASRPPRGAAAQDDGFDVALGAACSAHAARPESAPPKAPDGPGAPRTGHDAVAPKETETQHEPEPASDGRTRAIAAALAAPFPGVAPSSAGVDGSTTTESHAPAAGPAVRLLPTSPRIEPALEPGAAVRPGPASGIGREPLHPIDAPAARDPVIAVHGDPPAKPASSPESHGADSSPTLEAIAVRSATRAIPPALAGGGTSERAPKASRETAGREHAPETVSGEPASAPSRASDARVESAHGVASARSRAPRARADARASAGAPPEASTPRTVPAGGLDAVAGDAAEPGAADAAAPARPLPDLPATNRPATQATLVLQDEAGLDGRITVALRGDRLRTTIVTNPEAAERLSGRLGELQQALAARGLEDVQISVRSLAAGTPHGGEDRGSRHEERPLPSSSRDPESYHPHGRTRQERRRDPSER